MKKLPFFLIGHEGHQIGLQVLDLESGKRGAVAGAGCR